VTKGTAPTVSLGVNPATNRISTSGFVYDAAGNLTAWPVGNETVTAWYTYENQMRYVTTPAGSEAYWYTVAGQRARQGRTGSLDRYFFYGLRGELLGIYGSTPRANGTYYISTVHSTRVWLGGLLVTSDGNSITRDQLGSVVNSGTETLSYYPYGEQRTGAATNDREKFATYLRDENTRLDYAQARYYSSTWGRFTTADPYTMSGGLGNPQGWNRYAYVGNDPANFADPSGLNRWAVTLNYSYCSWYASSNTISCTLGSYSYIVDDGLGGGGGPFYFAGAWDSGGGGGGGIGKSTRIDTKAGAKTEIGDALGAIDDNCFKILGISRSAVNDKSSNIMLFDGCLTQDKQSNILQLLLGINVGSNATVNSVTSGWGTVILRYADRSISRYVVLSPGFFDIDSGHTFADQLQTLAHKALHYATQLDDLALGKYTGYSGTDVGAASTEFTNW